MERGENSKPANQSVVKLLQLVAIIAQSKAPMRLQDIAESANIPLATCLRYLNALNQEGYVYQDTDSARYSMTWKICSLGDNIRAHRSFRAISGDIVSNLLIKLDLGICLVVEHEMECMYLDCLYDSLSVGGTLVRIGKQTPLYASGSGKILLTEYSEERVDEMIAKKGFVRLTEKTISSKEQLMAEIEKVRQSGFAVDDEECEDGLRCVAVPVYDYTEKVAAAISAFSSTAKMTQSYIQEHVLPSLRAAAQELSFRMGSTKRWNQGPFT